MDGSGQFVGRKTSMKKKEMNQMESRLRERLMKERWQKTAEQEKQTKYAIKVPVDDGWLYVTQTDTNGDLVARTFDTREEAEALKKSIDYLGSDALSQVVEYHKDPFGNRILKLTQEEIEELRVKKQAIHEELKDKIPGTIKNMDHEQLEEYAWWLYKRVGVLERERKFSMISRVEVIGPKEREYVRYFNEEEYMDWDLQDDDRTLKIFIEKNDE